MGEFSADWLALREPVDHRSRNLSLQNQVIDFLHQRAPVVPGLLHVTDLGSGTGSNLRALAPHFEAMQCWTLVDYDADLLRAARTTLLTWADSVLDSTMPNSMHSGGIFTDSVQPLVITKNMKTIAVQFRCADLLADYRSILNEPADLITAAAFFDLVDESWLTEFCAALTKPLYTVLTYDGKETWSPPNATDADVLRAFHAHQSTDKGFGAALGPKGAERLQSLLQGKGYTTACEPSPWRMDYHERTLIEQLAMGTASAVREMGILENSAIDQWEQARRQASHCEIGHIDLFAYRT
jgi:trans-aconitate methyltransferase